MTRDISMASLTEGYMNFQNAGKIRGCNIFSGVFGTWQTLAGPSSLSTGNAIGFVGVGIGDAWHGFHFSL